MQAKQVKVAGGFDDSTGLRFWQYGQIVWLRPRVEDAGGSEDGGEGEESRLLRRSMQSILTRSSSWETLDGGDTSHEERGRFSSEGDVRLDKNWLGW